MSEVITKRVKAPLSVDEMKDAFLNKADRDAGKIKYIVDYVNSTIKGDILLQYLSNLEIQADFDFTGTSKQEKFDFLLTYFKMKTIIKNKDLNYAAGAVVLRSKDYAGDFLQQDFLTGDEVEEFYVLHKNLVDKWSLIIDSSLLLLVRVSSPQTSLDEYEDLLDPNYCGVNFVNLYRIDGFFNAFTSRPAISDLKWFTHQFENFAFNNLSLIQIISKVNQGILSAFNVMNCAVYDFFDQDFLIEIDKEFSKLEKENAIT